MGVVEEVAAAMGVLALEGEGHAVGAAVGERARGREAGRAARQAREAARIQALEAERLRNELVWYKCDRAGCTFDGNHTRAAIKQHKENHRYLDQKARQAREARAAAVQQAQAARGRQRGRANPGRGRGQILQ